MMLLSYWGILALSAFIRDGAAVETIKTTSNTHSWQQRGPAPGDHGLKLHVALRLADDGAAIERQLLALSDPSSPLYRQHLKPEQAIDLAVPSPESIETVKHWLGEHDLLKNATLSGAIYEVYTDVASAQNLLNTTYHVYSHNEQHVVRTEAYELPSSIAGHVEWVTPTTFFPKPAVSENSSHGLGPAKPELARHEISTRTSCGSNDQTAPSCIRQIYGINYTAQPNRTVFAVYGTEAATFKSGDLNTFLSRYGPPGSSGNAQLTVIGNGAPNETSGIEPAFETALDTQTLIGLAWPAAGLLYRNGGVFGPNPGASYDPFVQFLQQLISNATVPSVVSFSESNPESDFDPAYAQRLCLLMAQVGARGTSLLFSTGDNGPSVKLNKNVVFQPRFPASCPWVTAVGGTTNLANETAATQSTIQLVDRISYSATGGGFSNYFPAPDYQSSVVSGYISSQVPQSYSTVPGFNASGRGYPDVSAFSTSFPVVMDFITVPIGGTSASTPTWAAVITLLNDYEASKGRPSLGFLNPWLYNLTSGLKDITTGGNNAGACGFSCGFTTLLGYNVVPGWDSVTGLGSPIFNQLTQALDAAAR